MTNEPDFLLDGRVLIHQPLKGYRAAIDPVFLAASVLVKGAKDRKILDVGAGAGAVSLCIAKRLPDAQITGIEVQPEGAALFRRNIDENGLSDRVRCIEGDITEPWVGGLEAESFDQIVSNPPYAESGTPSPNPNRAKAHGDGSVSLEEWLRFCLKMVRRKGRITLVHRADKLDAILNNVAGKAGDVVVLPLFSRPSSPSATRVIISMRKGVANPATLLRGVTVHPAEGQGYTPTAHAILREAAPLALDGGDEKA